MREHTLCESKSYHIPYVIDVYYLFLSFDWYVDSIRARRRSTSDGGALGVLVGGDGHSFVESLFYVDSIVSHVLDSEAEFYQGLAFESDLEANGSQLVSNQASLTDRDSNQESRLLVVFSSDDLKANLFFIKARSLH